MGELLHFMEIAWERLLSIFEVVRSHQKWQHSGTFTQEDIPIALSLITKGLCQNTMHFLKSQSDIACWPLTKTFLKSLRSICKHSKSGLLKIASMSGLVFTRMLSIRQPNFVLPLHVPSIYCPCCHPCFKGIPIQS